MELRLVLELVLILQLHMEQVAESVLEVSWQQSERLGRHCTCLPWILELVLGLELHLQLFLQL